MRGSILTKVACEQQPSGSPPPRGWLLKCPWALVVRERGCLSAEWSWHPCWSLMCSPAHSVPFPEGTGPSQESCFLLPLLSGVPACEEVVGAPADTCLSLAPGLTCLLRQPVRVRAEGPWKNLLLGVLPERRAPCYTPPTPGLPPRLGGFFRETDNLQAQDIWRKAPLVG